MSEAIAASHAVFTIAACIPEFACQGLEPHLATAAVFHDAVQAQLISRLLAYDKLCGGLARCRAQLLQC